MDLTLKDLSYYFLEKSLLFEVVEVVEAKGGWWEKCCDLTQMNFIYSEKATKFCEIFTLLLTVCTVVKSKVKFLQSFVAFSEYMNFIHIYFLKPVSWIVKVNISAREILRIDPKFLLK